MQGQEKARPSTVQEKEKEKGEAKVARVKDEEEEEVPLDVVKEKVKVLCHLLRLHILLEDHNDVEQ